MQHVSGKVRVVIIISGEGPLGLPQALWPVGKGTVLEAMLDDLVEQGIGNVVVCCDEKHRAGVTAGTRATQGASVRCIAQGMPRGRGGIIKDAAVEEDAFVVLMHANMIGAPDLSSLVAEHEKTGADLSIVMGGDVTGLGGDGNQIFIASRSALPCIPEMGYCDIKEGLIPTLVQRGMKVRRIEAPAGWGCFGTWREYLGEVLRFVEAKRSSGVELRSSLVVEESSSRVGEKSSQVVKKSSSRVEGGGSRGDEETGTESSRVVEKSSRGGELRSSQGVKESSSQVELHEDREVSSRVEGRSSGEAEKWSSGACGSSRVDGWARVVGEVWIGEGVRIDEEAVIIGPAVIGPNCRIGRGAVVAESVLWEGSTIDDGAAVTECLVDAGAVVGAGVELAGMWCRGIPARRDRAARGQDARATFATRGQDARATLTTHGQDARATLTTHGQDARATSCAGIAAHRDRARTCVGLGRLGKACLAPTNKVMEDVEAVLMKAVQAAAARLSAALGDRISAKAWWWSGAAAVATCFLWAYWNPTVVSLWRLWLRSDEFSSGLLVPFLAVYILWSRWRTLKGVAVRPAVFWGIAAFAAAQAMRFFGLWLMYGSAENLSLVASICALVLLLFGWKVVWRVWPVLAFLLLMLPFPHRVQGWITQPLQRWATSSAVFGLEMLGFEVGRQGNVINLNGTMVAVAEACNGLRMLTAFVVIAALVALVVERRWWEKAIIVASSVPIAFACNTLRLVITAIAFTRLNTEAWEKAFHDFGGLAMMPVALAMVMGLLWLMGQVVVHEEQAAAREPQVVKKGAISTRVDE